jgi:predicted nuclease of predicted toxin-antitoxin system
MPDAQLWLDAQLSPRIARWIGADFALEALPLRELGLRDACDREIFFAARQADAIVITKDADFVRLLRQYGPPPRVIWLRCGNTSEARLREILLATLLRVLALLDDGESLVEIADPL